MYKKGVIKDIQQEISIPEDLLMYVKSLSSSTGESISQTIYNIITTYYVGRQIKNDRAAINCNQEMSDTLDRILVNSGFRNISDLAVSSIVMHIMRNNNQCLLTNKLPDIGINVSPNNKNVRKVTKEKSNESLQYEVDYAESEIAGKDAVLNDTLNSLQADSNNQTLITKDFFTQCSAEYILNLTHGKYTSYNSVALRKPKDRKGIYDYCCFTNGCDDHFLDTRQLLTDIGVEADPIEIILIYLLSCSSNIDPYTSYEFYFDNSNELHSWLKSNRKGNIYEKVNIIYNCWLQGIRILPAINTPCFAFLYYTFFDKAEYLCEYNTNVMNTMNDMIPVLCVQRMVFRIIMTKFNRDVTEVFDEECLKYFADMGII